MNKPVYLGLSILELSKTVMYEFRQYYIDRDSIYCRYSFVVYIETQNIFKDIAKDVKTSFDTSNYKLGGKIMK